MKWGFVGNEENVEMRGGGARVMEVVSWVAES